MMSFQKPTGTPQNEVKVISKVFGKVQKIVCEASEALRLLPAWERALHIFRLLGPFIVLMERSPADCWLSVIAWAFVGRPIGRREGWWLKVVWVRLAFLFWAACLLSAALSQLPLYSLGETIVWFRFLCLPWRSPLAWSKQVVGHAMLLLVGVGMMLMCLILVAEISIIGVHNGRLSWPYGDLVPGNYLAKACLPAFVVVVALATSSNGRTASWAAIIALISIVASVMTGERINSYPRL